MSGLIQLLSSWGVSQTLVLKAAFYTAAVMTCLLAFRVVTCRNVFHGAVHLALTLMGIAVIYLFLDAEFVAVIQVLIYVGAVIMLFIFAIMLTANIGARALRQTSRQVLSSLAVSAGIFIVIFMLVRKAPWQAAGHAAAGPATAELGRQMLTAYLLPFEVISLILLAALVGAIVIGSTKE